MNSSIKPVFVVGLITMSVAIVVGISDWRAAHAKDIIPWRADLETAKTEAKQSHHRVFAYFTASWCPPCQKMKSTTWADDTVRKSMEKFVPVKIDVDAHRDLALQFGIEQIPTFIVLSVSGEVERRTTRYLQPEDMVGWLER